MCVTGGVISVVEKNSKLTFCFDNEPRYFRIIFNLFSIIFLPCRTGENMMNFSLPFHYCLFFFASPPGALVYGIFNDFSPFEDLFCRNFPHLSELSSEYLAYKLVHLIIHKFVSVLRT